MTLLFPILDTRNRNIQGIEKYGETLMYVNSEGIVFRQVKAAGGRRMLLIFTRKYGKISAGSNLSEKGRSKAALALRPFTYGQYEFFKNRDYYNLNSGETRKSFFRIGEDLDKYFTASMALEITEKALGEEFPQPKIFDLLLDFLTALELREQKHETLLLAYEIKLLNLLGTAPEVSRCACCSGKDNLNWFSVKDGGIICDKCKELKQDKLIFKAEFDIVEVVSFFVKNPMRNFSKIALDEGIARKLQAIVRDYMAYHLDISQLKSDGVLEGNF